MSQATETSSTAPAGSGSTCVDTYDPATGVSTVKVTLKDGAIHADPACLTCTQPCIIEWDFPEHLHPSECGVELGSHDGVFSTIPWTWPRIRFQNHCPSKQTFSYKIKADDTEHDPSIDNHPTGADGGA